MTKEHIITLKELKHFDVITDEINKPTLILNGVFTIFDKQNKNGCRSRIYETDKYLEQIEKES